MTILFRLCLLLMKSVCSTVYCRTYRPNKQTKTQQLCKSVSSLVQRTHLALSQGVVTYTLPVEAFATTIKFFDWQKLCFIAWSFPSEARLISKGHYAAVHSWWLIFSSSEVTLIPWSAPSKGLDHLIQFWSRSKAPLHGTCDYLLSVGCGKWPQPVQVQKAGGAWNLRFISQH